MFAREIARRNIFIANIIDANWRAATYPGVAGETFNIGGGTGTSLNQLIEKLNGILGTRHEPVYEPARKGDVRHSLADISKASKMLGYSPAISLEAGLQHVLDWYRNSSIGT